MQNNEYKNQERRSGNDRRSIDIGLDFPFVDSHGLLVTEERRKWDRRENQEEAVEENPFTHPDAQPKLCAT